MDEYIRANRDHWNEITPINAASELYDLEAFKTGKRARAWGVRGIIPTQEA